MYVLTVYSAFNLWTPNLSALIQVIYLWNNIKFEGKYQSMNIWNTFQSSTFQSSSEHILLKL